MDIEKKVGNVKTLIKSNKKRKAFDLLIEEYNRDCRDINILLYLGIVASTIQPKISIDALNKAIEIKKDLPQAFFYLAKAYNALNKHEEAIELHMKLIESYPGYEEITGKNSFFRPYKGLSSLHEKVSCPWCFSENYKMVFVCNASSSQKIYGRLHPLKIWVQCLNCDLVYINPMPTDEALEDYYDTMYLDEAIDRFYSKVIQSPIRNAERLEKIETLYNKYISNNYQGKLLDLGASIGLFLNEALLYGWDAYGVELSKYAVEEGKKCLSSKADRLICMDIESKDFPIEKFDVITLWEVIEHVKQPKSLLKQIYNRLSDNGLLVLGTPDLSSTHHRYKGVDDVFWLVPGHLAFFSRENLMSKLNEIGFNVVAINTSREVPGGMEIYAIKK